MNNPATDYSTRFLQTVGKSWAWVLSWAQRNMGYTGLAVNDEQRVTLVKVIQSRVFGEEANVSRVDGMLGNMTYRRMIAIDSSEIPKPAPKPGTRSGYLIYAGKQLPVDGLVVDHSLDLNTSVRARHGRDGGGKWGTGSQGKQPKMLGVIHWDACLDARRGFNALVAQGYGSTLGIDNDGTVYQWMDPGVGYGYHAGTPANEYAAISIDLSNAVYLEHQARYTATHGPRPVVTPLVGPWQGKRHLGMYKVQIVALLRVLKAFSAATGLPLRLLGMRGAAGPGLAEWGINRDYPNLWTAVRSGEFRGVVSHQHITNQKWDVRCLWEQILYHLFTDDALRAEIGDVGVELTDGLRSDLLAGVAAKWEGADR